MIGVVRSWGAMEILRNSATAERPSEYGQSADWRNYRGAPITSVFSFLVAWARTGGGDRDCVGLPTRCCARTKDSPALRRKTNCIEWSGSTESRRAGRLVGSEALQDSSDHERHHTALGLHQFRDSGTSAPPALLSAVVFLFFRPLFLRFSIGEGLREGFSLPFVFVLSSLLRAAVPR